MSLDAYLQLLRSATPADVRIGERFVEFRTTEEIAGEGANREADEDPPDVSSESEGKWSWLVIAWEDGDRFLIDLADQEKEFPVYLQFAQIAWNPARIADSVANFFRALDLVRTLAADRDTPAALPIPGPQRGAALREIAARNPRSEMWFWQRLLRER